MAVLNKIEWKPESSQQTNPTAELIEVLTAVHNAFYHPQRHTFAYQDFADSPVFNRFNAAARALNQFQPETLASRGDKLAFWINVYNMLIIHSVIANDIKTSVHDGRRFFSDNQYHIGEHRLSLDDIEHGVLRGNSKKYLAFSHAFNRNDPRNRLLVNIPDPRVHFALYSACRSSAPWHIYRPETLNEQLQQAIYEVLKRDLKVGAGGASMQIPKVFQWYEHDFGDRARVIALICETLADDPQLAVARDNPGRVEFSYLDFDWSLNNHTIT